MPGQPVTAGIPRARAQDQGMRGHAGAFEDETEKIVFGQGQEFRRRQVVGDEDGGREKLDIRLRRGPAADQNHELASHIPDVRHPFPDICAPAGAERVTKTATRPSHGGRGAATRRPYELSDLRPKGAVAEDGRVGLQDGAFRCFF